jgi:hypothetical protein
MFLEQVSLFDVERDTLRNCSYDAWVKTDSVVICGGDAKLLPWPARGGKTDADLTG